MLSSSNPADAILVALRKIMRAVDRHSKTLAQRYGLTGPQLVVLRQLEREDPMSIGALARNVSLSHATVTGIVDRLERAALVERRRLETDRRRVLVGLGEKGRSLLAQAPPLLQERFVERLDALEDWERTLILSSLQRIALMMEATDIDASPLLVSGPVDATADSTVALLGSEGG